ncbi:MAG: tyrosine--tRNA ligase [Candidatus Terrybacteria bacterium RIFCSPLOWO2_01_FULL_44_24]|uniref:Tyrosine--tRNA ligase n=1 Tax=Candidatus Terrybacteria bacterium RIFCSPHIGHO2_01_FULL_43_35 TaxID=1802361 RepID=A0A1G2PEP3_9BACT|nr:MAG: tyrosine--tRNA ligase [Candidatus Terrybacteria bacterium RIFCSPHIGHO2_01_FULL_43_35]OHA51044.1 MAG: tyrosine--tRNA ligase [Candidatus Terrybacteria bacterium RIFCSPLOWO2_01_FULL_44_24]
MTGKKQQDILKRGVVKLIKEDEIEKNILSGRPLRIKHGIDPTGNQLHLGYAVIYRKLKALQDLGHTIVFLVGDFTARFGDPTGRMESRGMRNAAEVRKLADSYVEQISRILDPEKLEVHFNSEWYDTMKLEELFSILANFTTAQILERDMFQERIKKGKEVALHELLYPILQGYDSVMLKSDLTVIGSDQIFNELAGRHLQKIYNQEPQGIIALEVLPGTDGKKKMSQSLGNTIGLSEAAQEQFGKIMSIPDDVISTYFTLLTDRPQEEIDGASAAMKTKKINPRDEKELLAHTIVEWIWGQEEAEKSKDEFIRVNKEKKIPTRTPEKIGPEDQGKTFDLPHFLSVSGATATTSAARRLISQRAVYIDGELATDNPYPQVDITKEHIVKYGKKAYKIKPRSSQK